MSDLQGFEKLISGLYLGDIVRRVMLKMAKETGLFGDPIPPRLFEGFSLRYSRVFSSNYWFAHLKVDGSVGR